MGSGFVKMMRSVEANELRKDHKTFTLLSLIADRARRESGCEMHNGIMVCLEVGEAIIGDYKSCGLSEREYRTCKEKLVSMRQITIKTSNKGTIAKLISNTIFDINLDDYQMSKERQANDGQSDRHTDEQRDRQENSVSDSNIIECSNESKQSDGQSDRHTDRRSAAKATTNKNLRIKELNTNVRSFPENSPEYQLSLELLEKIQTTGSSMKEPDLNKWADIFDKMHRIDKKDYGWLMQIIGQVFKDDFWKGVIRSPEKLRTQINSGKIDRLIKNIKKWDSDEVVIQSCSEEVTA